MKITKKYFCKCDFCFLEKSGDTVQEAFCNLTGENYTSEGFYITGHCERCYNILSFIELSS
jgi:hypothetical protein